VSTVRTSHALAGSLVPGARLASRLGLSDRSMAAMAVLASATVGAGWHLFMSLRRADGLTSGAFDQAYFQQLVWNLSQGNGLRSSFNPGEFLGLHFSPLLALPAALQPLWSDARLLHALQALAIGLSVVAAFLLVRAILRSAPERHWMAAALALPIPFWAVMQQQTRAGFHTEILALPLILLAGWAGLTQRAALFWLFALLALGAKEDQVFPVAVIGLLVAARAPGRVTCGMRRMGLALTGVAVVWAVLVFGLVMPALRAGVTYDIDRYYAWLGGAAGLLRAPFEQTDALVAALTRPEGWLVTGGLVISLALLPLLRPRWALLLVPPTVVHLLSRHEPQPQLLLQYGLLLVVPAIVAGGLGARRLLAFGRRARHGARSRPPVARDGARHGARSGSRRRNGRAPVAVLAGLGLLIGPAFGVAFARGAVPPFSWVEQGFYSRPAAVDRLVRATSSIPPGAPISADWGAAAILADRPRLELPPVASPDTYVVIDRSAYVTGVLRWRDRGAWLEALEDSGRRLLVDDGRFQVWGPLDG